MIDASPPFGKAFTGAGPRMRRIPRRTALPSTPRVKLTVASAVVTAALLVASCGEPLPLSAEAPPIPERLVIAKRADVPGRVVRDRGVLILETHGSPFQAGRQQGALMRDRIREQVRDYHERRSFSAFTLTPGFVHRFQAQRQESHLTADEREFLRGLSETSGLSVADLLLLSADAPYAALSRNLPGLLPTGGGFIARGKATSDGQPLLGRLSDDLTFGVRQRYAMLWVHRPEVGPAWVALTRVGSLAAEAAWNADGLYASVDPIPGSARMAGLPPRWLTLRVMTSAGPDAAEAELRKVATKASQRFVATLARGDGARFVEADGGRVSVRSYGSGGALPDLAQSLGRFKTSGRQSPEEDPREARFESRLAAQYGQLDVETAKHVLSDVTDPLTENPGPSPRSIARAVPLRMALGPLALGDWGSLTTSAALIAQPQTQRLWVAIGRDLIDDAEHFVDFHLADLLTEEASASEEPR